MKSISDIDTGIPEGRLLLMAIVKLSTSSHTEMEPDEILGKLQELDKQVIEVTRRNEIEEG